MIHSVTLLLILLSSDLSAFPILVPACACIVAVLYHGCLWRCRPYQAHNLPRLSCWVFQLPSLPSLPSLDSDDEGVSHHTSMPGFDLPPRATLSIVMFIPGRRIMLRKPTESAPALPLCKTGVHRLLVIMPQCDSCLRRS